jgi:hypothetical protein
MSTNAFNRILTALRSRLARNLYFWGVTLFFVLGQTSPYKYDAKWYYLFLLLTASLLLVLTYTNNLLLVPNLLAKRRQGWYLLSVTFLLLTISILYVAVIKIAQEHFPVMQVQQISFVSGPVGKGWTINDFSEDMGTYLVGFVLWILIFTMAWFMNDHGRQRKIAMEAEKKKAEIELHFLKSQLNPHFLFNTLNNLYGLALKKIDTAPESILKLSSILRYMLYESNIALVSFEKEKEIIEAYISLELLRLTNNQNLNFTIASDTNYMLPPLLWLPVLENAFKYGTRYIGDDYRINFWFVANNNELLLKCENTYKTHQADKAHSGIGLQNLKKRLDLLYPNKYNIDVRNGGEQYNIQVKVKLA